MANDLVHDRTTTVMREQPARIEPAVLLEWFGYDPDTGIVRWKKQPSRNVYVGDAAGCSSGRAKSDRVKYVRITLHGRLIYAHQIAFVCMIGRYAIGDTDHINGIGTDNRWANLREVTHSGNCRNQPRNIRNKSGAMGVYRHRGNPKWLAHITVNRRLVHLGSFETFEQAVEARKNAEQKHGYHRNHGRA